MARRPAASTGPHASAVEPGRQQQRLRRVVLPEAHDLEHRERVVPGGVVDDLHHPDRAHLLAEGEGVDGDAGVAEARVDARRVEASCRPRGRRPASRSCTPGAGRRRVQQRHERRVHHVLARRPASGRCRRPRRRGGRRSWRCSRCSRRRGRAARRRPGWRSRRPGRRRRARRRRGRPCCRSGPTGPTSSRSGWATMAGTAWMPTVPGRPLDDAVRHWLVPSRVGVA